MGVVVGHAENETEEHGSEADFGGEGDVAESGCELVDEGEELVGGELVYGFQHRRVH